MRTFRLSPGRLGCQPSGAMAGEHPAPSSRSAKPRMPGDLTPEESSVPRERTRPPSRDPCGRETTRRRSPHRPSRDVLARPVRRRFPGVRPPARIRRGRGGISASTSSATSVARSAGLIPETGHRPAPRRAIGLPLWPGPGNRSSRGHRPRPAQTEGANDPESVQNQKILRAVRRRGAERVTRPSWPATLGDLVDRTIHEQTDDPGRSSNGRDDLSGTRQVDESRRTRMKIEPDPVGPRLPGRRVPRRPGSSRKS